MPQQDNSPNNQPSKTDTPHRQYPGARGSDAQAQEFINEYETQPFRGKTEQKPAEAPERRRADVPSGPDEHDRRLPPSVAQGD